MELVPHNSRKTVELVPHTTHIRTYPAFDIKKNYRESEEKSECTSSIEQSKEYRVVFIGSKSLLTSLIQLVTYLTND